MERYSWSKIKCFADCPMKYKKRYVDRIYPRKKSTALCLGYCMSCGLNAYRKTGSLDAAQQEFMNGWKEDGQILLLKKEDDPRRSVERGLEILYNYIETYPDEPSRTVQSEIKFEHEVANGIIFNGRIDGVLRLDDGSFAIIEDKTTSRLGDSYFVKMKGSSQVLWYMWVANELGLFNIDGHKQLPKCFINAIYIHHERDRFERDITMKTEKALTMSMMNMLDWIRQIQVAEATELFPFNDVDNSICTAYGGCEYLPLKYATGRMYERILNSDFVIHEKSEDKVDEDTVEEAL